MFWQAAIDQVIESLLAGSRSLWNWIFRKEMFAVLSDASWFNDWYVGLHWYILDDLVTPVTIRESLIISRFRCLGHVGHCAASKQEPDSVKGGTHSSNNKDEILWNCVESEILKSCIFRWLDFSSTKLNTWRGDDSFAKRVFCGLLQNDQHKTWLDCKQSLASIWKPLACWVKSWQLFSLRKAARLAKNPEADMMTSLIPVSTITVHSPKSVVSEAMVTLCLTPNLGAQQL